MLPVTSIKKNDRFHYYSINPYANINPSHIYHTFISFSIEHFHCLCLYIVNCFDFYHIHFFSCLNDSLSLLTFHDSNKASLNESKVQWTLKINEKKFSGNKDKAFLFGKAFQWTLDFIYVAIRIIMSRWSWWQYSHWCMWRHES